MWTMLIIIIIVIIFSSLLFPYSLFAYILWLPVFWFYASLKCVNERITVSCAFTCFLLFVCFVLLWCVSLGFIVSHHIILHHIISYYITSYHIIYFLTNLIFFLMRERKWLDLNRKRCREDLGGVEGEKNLIRISYVKKNLFSVNG